MTIETRRPETLPQNEIGQVIQAYIDSDEFRVHAKTKNTKEAYSQDFSHFEIFCQTQGIDSISSLRTRHINTWLRAMEINGFSMATVQRRKSSLSGFLDWARENHLLSQELEESIAPAWDEIASQKVKRGLNQTQIDVLLAAAKQQKNLRDAAFIVIALQTGKLLEEMVDLDCHDIFQTEDGMKIRFYDPKHDEYDFRNVDEKAQVIITNLLDQTGNDPINPLFMNERTRERITRQGLWLSLCKYRFITGIRNLSPAILRNTYFDNLARQEEEISGK